MSAPRKPRQGERSRSKSHALARAKKHARERGIALVMVLGAIAVLTVMLAEFQDETSAEAASATAERDAVQAEYMAKSAVNLSRLLIATEPTIRASIAPLFMMMKKTPPQLPVWEFSDRILGAFNDDVGAEDFSATVGVDAKTGKNLGIKDGRFELVIVDEDAKINANLGASNDIAHIRLAQELMGLMAPPQYNTLFDQRDGNGQFHDRFSICSAIIDWGDQDESLFNCDLSKISGAASSGAEDAYYQLLPKAYRRKNAPYDSLDELRMVRGVGEDVWATFVDPDPSNPKKRAVTVWGTGRVNVNTANAQTLLGVVCAGAPTADICNDVMQAQTFLTGVTMARGLTMGAPLFGSPTDFIQTMTGKGQLGPVLAAFGMKPVAFKSEAEFAKSIATESKVFSIYAVGVKKGGLKRETRISVHAVVDFQRTPSISQANPLAALAGAVTGSPAPSASNTAATQNAVANASAAAQNAAFPMMPVTAGQMIYYRVD
jgi:general secretion pathway protein K